MNFPNDVIVHIVMLAAKEIKSHLLISKALCDDMKSPKQASKFIILQSGGDALLALLRLINKFELEHSRRRLETSRREAIYIELLKSLKGHELCDESLLTTAAKAGNLLVTKYILSSSSSSNSNSKNSNNLPYHRALTCAIGSNRVEIVRCILRHMPYIASSNHIIDAIESGSFDIIKEMDMVCHDKMIDIAIKLYDIDLVVDIVRGHEDGKTIASALLDAISDKNFYLVNEILIQDWRLFDVKKQALQEAERQKKMQMLVMLRAMWSM